MATNCNYCGAFFEDGQNVLRHEYDIGELLFCGSDCAGAYFVESECHSITFSEGDEE